RGGDGGEAGGRHGGQEKEPLREPVVEAGDVVRGAVGRGDRHPSLEHRVRTEAERYVLQATHVPEKRSRRDEQHERGRDLRGDESLSDPSAPPIAHRSAALQPQRVPGAGAEDDTQRREGEKRRNRGADDGREGEDPPGDGPPAQAGNRIRDEGHGRSYRRRREERAHDASGEGEEQGLDEERAHELTPRSPERDTDGQLASPLAGPDEDERHAVGERGS